MGRNLQDFLNRHLCNPPWRSIKTLGKLPILGVSITTLLSVPLLARAIATSRAHLDSFKLLIGDPRAAEWLQSIANSLQLPLTIKLLVVSAFFALIGRAIYGFACPPYFRIGESYDEFRRKYSFATDSIQADFIELWNETTPEIRSQMLLDLVQHYGQSITFHNGQSFVDQIHPLTPETVIHRNAPSPQTVPRDMTLDKALKMPAFGETIWETLLVHRDHSRPSWRRACAWVFYIAMLFTLAAFASQLHWIILAMLY